MVRIFGKSLPPLVLYSPVNRGTTVQGKLLTHNWITESITLDFHIALKLSLLFNKLEYNNMKGLHRIYTS